VRDRAHLLVYLGAASGAGKTQRLIDDGRRLAASGKRIATFDLGADVDALVASAPDVVLVDDLHLESAGGATRRRWQDAAAFRDAGIDVVGALNIANVDVAAPVAAAALGRPVAETVPIAFLRGADEVIALDASPALLRERGDRYEESALLALRQLLLRTIDDLTVPAVAAERTSAAAAIFPADLTEPEAFAKRSEAIAAAFDLELDCVDIENPNDIESLPASLIALPNGELAAKLVNRPVSRDIFVIARDQTYIADPPLSPHPLGATVRDRMRAGYGRLTIYLGAATGAGKTVAMLDRGRHLAARGRDVAIGYIDTRGRPDTAAAFGDLAVVPRRALDVDGERFEEFDREALIARKPDVVLLGDLAHRNVPGSLSTKRIGDVLAILRAGIDVISTVDVQQLEALGDAVFRLTGSAPTETLPDGVLTLADELILVDTTPEALRERGFPVQAESFKALRELAVREVLRAGNRQAPTAPFDRLFLSVVARTEDLPLILRCTKLAARVHASFAVAHVGRPGDDEALLERMRTETSASGGTWLRIDGSDPIAALLAKAREIPETTIAIGGTLRTPRWPQPNSFARRLLDAGARELFVLARRPS